MSKKRYELKCRGYVGRSPFDPNLRGQRRIFELEADSEDEVREIFRQAIANKDPGVHGGQDNLLMPFELESIEEIA